MKLFTIAAAIVLSVAASLHAATYTSPFVISLDPQIGVWTSDFSSRASQVTAQSTPTYGNWYKVSLSKFPYGPLLPQLYSSSSSANPNITDHVLNYDRGQGVYNVALKSPINGVSLDTWQRERLLQAAKLLIGTHYQHLHLPQFNPGYVTNGSYTWLPVSNGNYLSTTQNLEYNTSPTLPNFYKSAYGSAQPGIDCTDFSAYIYNLALGIQMHSGTASQVKFTTGNGPAVGNQPTATILSSTGAVITPKFLLGPNYGTNKLNKPGSLSGILSSLQPGDLLYMHDGPTISHVVVWLGSYGTNANGTPTYLQLIISSHDDTPAIFDTIQVDAKTGLPLQGTPDSHLPPPGVQILPFDSSNWFYQNFSFAMQIL